MKKKQLLALIMAGTLAAGMSPVTMAFAETDTQTMTIDDTAAVATESEEAAEPVQDTTEPAQEVVDTPAAEPTQEVVDTPAAEPTQEVVDTPAAEPTQAATEEVVEDGFSSGETDELTVEEEDIATQAEESSQIVIRDANGVETPYDSLQAAVDAAPTDADVTKKETVTQIYVKGTLEISATVVIDGKRNISIAPYEEGAVIKRNENFNDTMFKVTGGSAFQFEGASNKETSTLLRMTINGAPTTGDATGPVVSMDSGYFGISDGISIEGCRTKTGPSVVYNQGGSIGLAGGSITGNQSLDKSGAIYSDGQILVSGNIYVKDNNDDGTNDNSIILHGDNACIVAANILSDSASICVKKDDAVNGQVLVKLGAAEDGTVYATMENALAHVQYLDTAKFTVNSSGVLEEVNKPINEIKLTSKSVAWDSKYDNTVDITFHANDPGTGGKYYIMWLKQSEETPGFELVKKKATTSGDVYGEINAKIGQVAYDTPIKIVVYVENGSLVSAPLVLMLDAKQTPVTTTPIPTTRATINPSVSESTVTGLEKALAFYPKQMYNFSVKGAGTDNTDPIKGDTKWIPYGWSMSAKNIDTGYQKSWSIGNVNGIKQAKTFKMYIFFQKYIYNGTEWEATGVKEALTTEFKSKAIDFTVTPSGTITPTATDGSGGGGYSYDGTDGSGDGTDGEDDAENHDGTDSDTGSSSATNARTADNSPIATMMMLASLSLVAGGYVIVRKRKKEI